MRLADNEITIRIEGETIHLRPTLRAAYRLERRHGGFDALLGAVAHGSLSVMADIVAEGATTQEFIRDYGASAEAGTTFRTRFIEGVTPADRVSYAGQLHDIKEITEIGRRRGLELRTVARAAVS